MRIDRIDLIRYGHFADAAIDLPPGRPDFTIIYGNNEAGKSTLLRGMSALFFGVLPKTPDVHSCKGSELRIGAAISNGDDRLVFRRRKGTSNTLLDPEEDPIQENALAPFLRELDRQRFEQFFGLDHERLRAGGEELLRGEGDVGSALFQAAGLLDLRKLLEDLDEEARELFSPQSKGRVIGTAIAEYKEAKSEARKLAISGAAVKEMQADLEQAKQKHDTLKNEAQVLQQELVKLRRIAGNKPDIARLQDLRSALLALASVPVLHADARKQRDEAAATLASANSQIQTLNEQVTQRNEKIKALPAGASLKARATEIDLLNAGIAHYVSSVNDHRKRVGERDDACRLAEEVWREIWPKHPLAAAEQLRSVYSRKSEILDLITEQARLSTAFENASEHLREGEKDHERFNDELARNPEPPDTAMLRAAVEMAKLLGNSADVMARLKSDIDRLTAAAAREMQALSLWSGTLEQLEKFKTPLPATVEKFVRELEKLESRREDITLRASSLEESLAEKAAELGRYAAKVGKAGEAELAEVRGRRDELWRLIRDSVIEPRLSPGEAQKRSGETAPLAESFAQQMAKADEIADLRFAYAKDVALHDRLVKEIESGREQQGKLEAELAKVERQQADLRQRWAKEWGPLGAEPLSPPEMKEWMQARQAIVSRLEQVREKQSELSGLQEKVSAATERISAALTELGFKSPLEASSLAILIMVADRFADELEEGRSRVQELRRKLQSLQLEKRRTAGAECQRRLTEWSQKWSPLTRELLLPEASTPRQVRDALATLETVFGHLKEVERLEHRIKRIGDNIREFESKASQLLAEADPSLADLPPDSGIAQLHAKYVETGKAETAREAWEAENAADEKTISECRVAAQAAAATLAQLRQLAVCSDDQQLEAVLTAAELKSTKQEEYERIGQSLIERNAVPDLKQIEDEAAGFELDKLHSEIDSREERQKVLEDVELFEAAKEYGRLCQEYERLQASEESIQHAQKAEDALAKVRPAVAQYLRLRLASEVLERAIGSYREKHQGPVLQRASELFSRLTLGDHVGLTTAFGEGDKPVLMAVRQSMEQVEVGGLSDGTRDQMYLALRLAAIEHHIETVAPCPVIFDDILINSDDSRAAAALEIISELARRTQVLFFTHHTRLAELGTRSGAQLIQLRVAAAAVA